MITSLWDVLDQFLAKHQAQLEQSKRPLYYAAIARAKQGNAELAEQLAKKAAEIDSQTTLESFFAAKDLEEHNQFDWAVREYRRSIDDEKIATHEGILARVYLASLLHDYEHTRRRPRSWNRWQRPSRTKAKSANCTQSCIAIIADDC